MYVRVLKSSEHCGPICIESQNVGHLPLISSNHIHISIGSASKTNSQIRRTAMERRPWQDIAHQVQSHRNRTLSQIQPPIPDVPSSLPGNVTGIPQALLSPREVEITTTFTEDLVFSLATGSLTSTEVTNAFLRRAGLAQKLVISILMSFYSC